MVASDSELIGTVTRMTASLWIAKRSVARGGEERTLFDKGDAVAFIQAAASIDVTEKKVGTEPDVYEYMLRTPTSPTITSVVYNTDTRLLSITGLNINSFQTLIVTYDAGPQGVFTRNAVLTTMGGLLTYSTLTTTLPINANNVTLVQLASRNGTSTFSIF
jgi:hypothetical protein